MRKKTIILYAILVVLALAGFLWWQAGQRFSENAGATAQAPSAAEQVQPTPSPNEAAGDEANESNLTAADFGLAGIKLGDSRAQMRKVLGESTLIEFETRPIPYMDNSLVKYEIWHYEDLAVTCQIGMEQDGKLTDKSEYVTGISVTGAGYKTARGIGIGSSVAAVMAAYGQCKPFNDVYTYDNWDELRLVEFRVAGGRVKEIVIRDYMD